MNVTKIQEGMNSWNMCTLINILRENMLGMCYILCMTMLEILHTHLGNCFPKVDNPKLRVLLYMRLFSHENIPLQIREPPTK
jgi:hypothetical protein